MLQQSNNFSIDMSPRQLQLILEAVLFTISPEINHTLYKSEILELLDLAIDLRKKYQHISTNNISLNKNVNSDITTILTSYFPELLSV